MPKVEHVPVAPHHGDRAQGRARRDPDPHAARCTGSPRRASPPTGSTRRRRSDRDKFDDALRLAPAAPRVAAGAEGPAGVPGHRQGRPLPRRGLRLHAEGRREGASRGRDADRLRLRRPHRGRPPLRRAPRSTASSCRCATRSGRATSSRSSPRPTQHPSRDWLKIVKSTARALEDQPVAQGRGARPLARARARAVRARGEEVPPVPGHAARVRGDAEARRRARLPVGRTTCWPSVGYGKTSVQQVLGKLAPARGPTRPDRAEAREARPQTARRTPGGVKIRGVDDLLVRFAQVLRAGAGRRHRGLHHARPRPHRARARLPDRRQERPRQGARSSRWSGTGSEPAKRPVRIAVYIGRDRPGLLAEITGAISSRHGNITKAEVTVTEDRKGINHFVVEVDDLAPAPGRSCRRSARSRTSSTSSASAGSSAGRGCPADRSR